jgi:Zn-dependent M28 family amino/carboxypeptidase
MNKMRPTLAGYHSLLIFSGILFLVLLVWIFLPPFTAIEFDGDRAYQAAQTQVEFGPRTPGSKAHSQMVEWAENELESNGWFVDRQIGSFAGQNLTNIIARKGSTGPVFLIAAHYDSRLMADQDTSYPSTQQPVPGANDGASGVAVIIELSRCLEVRPGLQIWLALFDGEDQGNLPGWDWILGSRMFVQQMDETPAAVVIVDMVGDGDLNILRETNSDFFLQNDIWRVARESGYGDFFIDQHGYSILDDHTPFLEKGIPALDIIDFDYPYWHTSMDTLDKISPGSLEAVGRTIENWLESYPVQ